MKPYKPLLVATLSAGLLATPLSSLSSSPEHVEATETASALLTQKAKEMLGAPHATGGESLKEGFDSSGLVQYVWKQAINVKLPRTLLEQSKLGETISREEIKPGDLIFFSSQENGSITSVGIYVGNGEMIYPSPSKGSVIQQDFANSSFWSPKFVTAKRITSSPEIAKEDPLVAEALKLIGTPYVFGSDSIEEGVDCSSFVQYVFEQAKGVYLPRSTDQQWKIGTEIPKEDMQVGDVIFFQDTYREGISHVGIYIGGNQFIHAKRSENVAIDYVSNSYWTSKFAGVRRFEGLSLPKEGPVVSIATKYIGEVPYLSGGTTPDGFDTGGFVQYVYKEALNVDLPRYGASQWNVGTPVEKENLQPGDMVFFKASTLNPAIYIGNDYVVHVTPSKGVTVTNIKADSYWAPKYYGAKRIRES
ncbi:MULTISPECIES: C40 family peptidase [Priestia]|uniref:C40 family peptidase n=1 Tax=Priestia TaxID=2800373 RepID=UPI002EDA2AC7